jgi:glucokinase
MVHGIGVLITERITVAAVSDHEISGTLRADPEDDSITDTLYGVPAETIVQRIIEQIERLDTRGTPAYIGLGMPGIVRSGIVQDSPNLVQFKGVNMQTLVTDACARLFGKVRVSIFNDADVMAAGIAA